MTIKNIINIIIPPGNDFIKFSKLNSFTIEKIVIIAFLIIFKISKNIYIPHFLGNGLGMFVNPNMYSGLML